MNMVWKDVVEKIKSWIAESKKALKIKSEPALENLSVATPVSELFTMDQMARHGIHLAMSHELSKKNGHEILLRRLAESEKQLLTAHKILTENTPEHDSFAPAREWLLDNFYLIQEQINLIRRDLPKNYGRSLPKLVSGCPRIYDIAFQFIEHSDSRWDLENLHRYINAYQEIKPLNLGELWALPITLGIALIENLSNASKRIIGNRMDYDRANQLADKMIEVASIEPKKLVFILAEMSKTNKDLSSSFFAELARRLQAAALILPLTWIEQNLAEEGLTLELLFQEENKYLAATQVTIGNSIAGLRHITEVNWRNFVEDVSIVNKILKNDPSNTYSNMDFATRDLYRHAVESFSRKSFLLEKEVAEKTIELCNTVGAAEIEQHVGYYLIGSGVPFLEKKLNIQFSIKQSIQNYCKKHARFLYFGFFFVFTFVVTAALVLELARSGEPVPWLCLYAILLLIFLSQLALALVNLLSTLLVKPKALPRMNYSKGIPENDRTLVVVPAMLSSEAGIESLIDALEIRYLGNRDIHLQFVLLTDFNDAKTEHCPLDQKLLKKAEHKIKGLNEKYKLKDYDQDTFFLFHRPRQWNAREKVWMGKERKRGKIADLNNYLRGKNKDAFSLIVGRTELLNQVKYVICLDSDTQLPRESARIYVATMSHPLNRPRINQQKNMVVSGHGILQPRVAEILPTHGTTPYIWIYGNDFGIDPYTRTVSDVYQDIFDEGSFIGKGIFDVDVFQTVLQDRLPENTVLSHDLLEGCYLRSGFLSDTPLYERSPSNYFADVKRRIRWIRGDWQIAGWLGFKVRTANNQKVKNPLSFLSKFKIFDNLRRSLVAPALLLLFILDWTFISETCFWFGLILVIVLIPLFLNFLLEVLLVPTITKAKQHLYNIAKGLQRPIAHFIVYLSFLPFEAWYSVIAISRTLFRMFFTKRHLLEWVPSDQANQKLPVTLKDWILSMWVGPFTALISIGLLFIHQRPECLFFASPLIALWIISPLIAKQLSTPIKDKIPSLDKDKVLFLRKMSRKTWDYFDKFMTAEDHWLPPDNFQEIPVAKLARRTSPTNIALALLANLTAYDFGYITLQEFLERTGNTLNTLTKLERYRGHLLNWYNTETLAPLLPRYVSMVDSGNFAGHLITLLQGLYELMHVPLLNAKYLEGLQDTLDILEQECPKNNEVSNYLNQFRTTLDQAKTDFAHWDTAKKACDTLCQDAEKIYALFNDAKISVNPDQSAILSTGTTTYAAWSAKLLVQCRTLKSEIQLFDDFPNLDPKVSLKDLPEFESPVVSKFLTQIYTQASQIIALCDMDVSFLVDEANHLMTIGFNVDEQRIDPSRYDLLASEARLGNFVAIAQGQVVQECWFALGRLFASTGGDPILMSWSGSMFEYLMPLLVMPNYPGTLLNETYRLAVQRQIEYGKKHGVPWGLSESGFNAFDTDFNYMYRAFGVPALGLKRGLEEDLVITPYASALALMVDPINSCSNLQMINEQYKTGKYGFYEAIDFTPSRLPKDGSKYGLVQSYMTHHQGMIFLAFSYLLNNQPMQRRFSTNSEFQSTLLLLQERVPKRVDTYLKIPKAPEVLPTGALEATVRVFNTPNTRTPQVQLLSNGNFHTYITQAGGGFSRWKNYTLTRFREDSSCDNWGLFCYIRDVTSGEYRTTIYSPLQGAMENYKVTFSESMAEFVRGDMHLDMHTEVSVSPEDDLELRRLRIHNRTKIKREIEFTSYAEVVIAPQNADLSQPAFSNLFVETEIHPELHGIIASRRPQDENDKPPYLSHFLLIYTDKKYSISYETDRLKFLGRNRTSRNPIALIHTGELSNTQGTVLDPIVAIRCRLILEPDDLVIFDLFTGASQTKENSIALIKKYQDQRLANRIFELAWTHGRVMLHQLNISEAEAQLFGKLASAILYTSRNRRAEARLLAKNRKGQPALWGYSISGDLPIILVNIEDPANIDLIKQLIKAQNYFRRKGLLVDIIILNEEHGGYRQPLQELITNLITVAPSDQEGKIIQRPADQVSQEDKILFQTVARVVLSDKNGTLAKQLKRHRVGKPAMPLMTFQKGLRAKRYNPNLNTLPKPKDLLFDNGYGGFSETGNEYVIHLEREKTTPAPWANVIANSKFGTLVSENGQGYTWFENAHEFRLSPFVNDPVTDASGEAYYIRDDETGHIWSPSGLPRRGQGDYLVRHGFGYSIFEHREDEIHSELTITVERDLPVKLITLTLTNHSRFNRKLSVAGFVAWVLGDLRDKTQMHIISEQTHSGVILAQNHYNADFNDVTAFFDGFTENDRYFNGRSVTADRTEFLGRNGSMQRPAALKRTRLSGRVEAGVDPCAAIQFSFDLPEGKQREIVFILGAANSKTDAEGLALQNRDIAQAKAVLAENQYSWKKALSPLQISTPDKSVNALVNGWLLYQVLSSRFFGRTGYYQSSGAFGFRDQLQDVLAFAQIAPHLCREHILVSCAHQFEEGDVQHWWHPPTNRGVRTRCSDDFLWLPFAICHYIEKTGDTGILNEKIHYLSGRPLKPEEESYYEAPNVSEKLGTVYEHAVAAITHGLSFGEHGLPLMGSGDWNDGMNKVGIEGKGESVWLAFFLYDVLNRFPTIAKKYGDQAFEQRCLVEKAKLQQNIEQHGWDGKWYRRAYFDDGSILGSSTNTECKIDSIAQSWSVLSECADHERAKLAMSALKEHLVSEKDHLIKLLAPPFDKSKPSPGYIQGYVPGIRENGGQYTHAAVWAIIACSKLGQHSLAWHLMQLINPVNHGKTSAQANLYKLEPYVLAGDVYSVPPHNGHGGWSWYTGSAGWLYRLLTETLMGICIEDGTKLRLNPTFPEEWDSYSVNLRHHESIYHINVKRVKEIPGKGNIQILLENKQIEGNVIELGNDGKEYQVVVNVVQA